MKNARTAPNNLLVQNVFFTHRRLGVFLALALFIFASTFPAAAGTDDDFAFDKLIKGLPPLADIVRMSEKHQTTLGIYGGTVRDLYLRHPFTVISDCDLMFDSSEPNFPAFRDELMAFARTMKGKMPTPDFHFDLSALSEETSRQHLFHTEGITVTKVGVMRGGKIFDPTGHGLEDLRNRVFRYHPPDRKKIDLHNLGRFIRDLVRLSKFTRDPATMALLKFSLDACVAPASPEGIKARESAKNLKTLVPTGTLLNFPALINPLRNDIRYAHNDLLDKLTPFFPMDMFYGDLFRCVTQADDMEAMREVFSTLGVDAFLRAVGLGNEADTLMNPVLSREALFARFQFPGYQSKEAERKLNFLETWETTFRAYNYRVLFDMLASEFPASSPECLYLKNRKNDFLATSTYRMLNPGDDYRDMILGFLDADFNLRILPRQKIEKSLDWFLTTYLPLGQYTLKPFIDDSKEKISYYRGFARFIDDPELSSRSHPRVLHSGPTHAAAGTAQTTALMKKVTRGYSPEILAIDRKLPHSFQDLDGYLAFQTGAELRSLYLDWRTSLGFFVPSEEVTALLLRHLGYEKIFQVNASGFNRRMRTLLGYNPATDRVILAQCKFYSDEQLLNHQARMYFLGRGKSGPESVFVMRDPHRLMPHWMEFTKYLKGLKKPIFGFFAGFTNPLKRLLLNPKTETVGDMVLTSGNLPLPDGGSGPLVLCLSGFGASYGAFPSRLILNLKDHGLKVVVYVGTGGGISGIEERFSWAFPASVYLAGSDPAKDSRPIRMKNEAEGLTLTPKLTRSNHATVQTPLSETQERVRRMKEKKTQSVDCELYHIASRLSIAEPPIKLYSLINITDFPMTDEESEETTKGTIAVENSPEQFRAVEEALKAIVTDIGQKILRQEFKNANH